MGTFQVTIEVGNLAGAWSGPMQALVDTGASHTVVPRPTLERLGIRPVERLPFALADESVVDLDVGNGMVRIDGRKRATALVFGGTESTIPLGASTLELFNLGVDPVHRRLIPVTGLLMKSVHSGRRQGSDRS